MNTNKILFPILLIIGAVVVFYLFIKPTYASIGELKVERTKYETALSDANQLKSKLDSMRDQLNSFSPDDMNRLDNMLPNHVDNVRLILELNNIANRHGMTLTQFSFTDQSDQSNQNQQQTESSSTEVQTVGINFNTTADYQSMIAFLKDLEKSLRVTDIYSVKVTVPKEATEVGSDYSYSVNLHTYWANY